MTPQQLSDRISTIAERAEQRLTKAVTKTQRELFDQMQTTLSKLELDGDGLIKQSQANRKILQKADRIFDRAVGQSGYYDSLGKFVDSIPEVATANGAYFDLILDAFVPDARYLKSLQKNSIATIESYLANDGLTSQLKQPLQEILSQNINTGASFGDLLKQVREFIVGTPDLDGRLMRYSKQIARDTLFNFSRSMQESIAENSGLQFYQYLGGIMDDTRPFCAARSNKFYHKSEIESWARQSWQGRRPGTTSSTIFIFAGGFSCLHQIIPVSESIVPKEVIERANSAR